jgi:acetyl-CoA carboxylase biotin carboxyl carrier protein
MTEGADVPLAPADGAPVPDGGAVPLDPGAGASARDAAAPSLEPGDASLLALVDRLGALLDRSELSELAVQAGSTRLVLRKATALAPAAAPGPGTAGAAEPDSGGPAVDAGTTGGAAPAAPARPAVMAPLTGVWYASPAPGSAAFVAVGREVAVGQVIGLIEAMKLFNEIKSDLAGRVVRVIPESGALVKAKQPLIEVEPL